MIELQRRTVSVREETSPSLIIATVRYSFLKLRVILRKKLCQAFILCTEVVTSL